MIWLLEAREVNRQREPIALHLFHQLWAETSPPPPTLINHRYNIQSPRDLELEDN